MGCAPTRRKRADDRESDGTAADHERDVAVDELRGAHVVDPDRHRLGERRELDPE